MSVLLFLLSLLPIATCHCNTQSCGSDDADDEMSMLQTRLTSSKAVPAASLVRTVPESVDSAPMPMTKKHTPHPIEAVNTESHILKMRQPAWPEYIFQPLQSVMMLQKELLAKSVELGRECSSYLDFPHCSVDGRKFWHPLVITAIWIMAIPPGIMLFGLCSLSLARHVVPAKGDVEEERARQKGIKSEPLYRQAIKEQAVQTSVSCNNLELANSEAASDDRAVGYYSSDDESPEDCLESFQQCKRSLPSSEDSIQQPMQVLASGLLIGSTVKLHGVKTPTLNGAYASVIRYDASTQKFSVRLRATGRVKSVKLCNLSPVETAKAGQIAEGHGDVAYVF